MVAEAPPAVDAWSIFQHARSAVTSVQYPWRVDYTIAISGLDGAKPVSDHYRGSCEPSDGSIKVFPISEEQLKAPAPVPHGFNASLTLGICFGGCGGFGLRYRRVPYNIKPVGNETALPVIATVSTKDRDYSVSLIGDAVVDGVDTYHLSLVLAAPTER